MASNDTRAKFAKSTCTMYSSVSSWQWCWLFPKFVRKSRNQIQGLKSQLQTDTTCAIHTWCFLLALLIECLLWLAINISQARKWLTPLSIATWQRRGNKPKYYFVNSSNGILQTWAIFAMLFTTSSVDNFAICSMPARQSTAKMLNTLTTWKHGNSTLSICATIPTHARISWKHGSEFCAVNQQCRPMM